MAKSKNNGMSSVGDYTHNKTDNTTDRENGEQIDVLAIDGTVDDSYVPEGFKTVEAFLDDMREEYQADLEFDKTNRDAALDDKKFAAGEQWDPVVLAEREGLPCMVINNIPQFTAQLVGDWREDRSAIKVVPSNDEDTDVASIRGDLIRSIEMQSRADRVYDSAFESLVQCGDGAFRISVEYARDDVFDQDIFIRPIEDALAVVWDRYSIDPTGRDARRVFVDDRIPKKEFEKKWPDAEPADLDGDDGGTMHGWVDDNSYKVTEYWRIIQRQRLMGLFNNGRVFELTSESKDAIIEQYGSPVKTRVAYCSYAQMHLVTGFAILSGPYEYRLNRLPIVRMSGRVVNVGGRRIRYGLVRFMKDPVRLKNFWRSIVAEQYGYAPKAQWIAPESAVDGREDKFRKAHLSRDPLIVYNDGAEAPPQRIEPPVPQAALSNEAQVNAQDMKDVTGIQDASLGIASNEVSGRAIQARQKEGDQASLTFYDNANAALLEGGDVINQLIPVIYDSTRTLRVIGDDEAVKFKRVNDPMDPDAVDLSVGEFDVALSTGASYTTRRDAAAQGMMDAIQVWPNLMGIAGDLVAKAQDWPGADTLAARLQKTIPPQFLSPEEQKQVQANGGPAGPTPEQIQQGVQELQQTKQQLQQLEQQFQTLKADRSIDMYNAETARIKALSDNQVDGNQLELDAIGQILDTSVKLDKHDIERKSKALDHVKGTHEFIANTAHDQANKAVDAATKQFQFMAGQQQQKDLANQAQETALQTSATNTASSTPSTSGS